MLRCLCSLLLLKLLGFGSTQSCTSRRCLANMLISKDVLTQPQSINCTLVLRLPSILYTTQFINTKELRFTSQMIVNLQWMDPDLAWNTSVYTFNNVILPADQIWVPSLLVLNAVSRIQKHYSKDLLVNSNGTVTHAVLLKTVVGCDVDMFKYPFVEDTCPISLNAWKADECGLLMQFGRVVNGDSDTGEWLTQSVELASHNGRNDRNTLNVNFKIRSTGPVVTLILPSVLIIIADVVSFALPIGGERVCFKVTLVLSFIMFLLILNDLLPADNNCSPLIRIHFCFSLFILVASMLVSMVLTRLTKDGRILPSCIFKCIKSKDSNSNDKEILGEGESESDISVISLTDAAEEKNLNLQKVFNFLERMASKEQRSKKHFKFANKLDKVYFWIYFIVCMIYAALILYLLIGYSGCPIDKLPKWNN
ncbi:5-hydroxytryptamine receptor 3A-like [Osmerus eperlanus]|uniref:5-hydroxytryptamine receptor 3A-like n=1 Tax=Osmerus eperlanus TaxID=29151 RepID=UPI002E1384CF